MSPRPAKDQMIQVTVRLAATVRLVEGTAVVDADIIHSTLDRDQQKDLEWRLSQRLAELFQEHGWGSEGSL